MTTANIQLITNKTNTLAAAMKIEDQLEGMSTSEKLADMARRFSLIKKTEAAQDCLNMKAMYEKLS